MAQPSIAQPLRHVHPSGFVWVFGPGHAHVLLKPGSFGLTGFMWKRQSSATSVPVGALGQKIEVFTKPAGHCGAQIEPSGIRPPRPECAATQTLSSEAAQPLGRAGDTAGLPQHPAPVSQSHCCFVPFGCQQPCPVWLAVQLQPHDANTQPGPTSGGGVGGAVARRTDGGVVGGVALSEELVAARSQQKIAGRSSIVALDRGFQVS